MKHCRPPLTEGQILAWADAHRARTGGWPGTGSGPVADAPGESWKAVDTALRVGCRGLPGGDSLPRLLARHRGAPPPCSWTHWTPEEDGMVRALPPAEAAERTGRTLLAVYQRRHDLGVGLPPSQRS
jgi:hypothetical protein